MELTMWVKLSALDVAVQPVTLRRHVHRARMALDTFNFLLSGQAPLLLIRRGISAPEYRLLDQPVIIDDTIQDGVIAFDYG